MTEITAYWTPVDPAKKGHAIECGLFSLDQDKSEFETATLHFRQKAKARLYVSSKPVLREGSTGEYDHGWDFFWHVWFIPTGWHHRQFNGQAKTLDMAKRMAFNLATSLYAAVVDLNEPTLDAAKVEALKSEVKAWRQNASMIRYRLKDNASALEAVKHYLAVGL